MIALLYVTALVAPPPVMKLSGHTDPVYTVALSADGKFAATGSFDKTLKLWDTVTGKEIKSFAGPNGHTGLVLTAAFSPTGDVLASGGSDNTVKLWDVPNGVPSAEFAFGAPVTAVAVRADGRGYAAAGADGKVRVFGSDGKPSHEFQGPAGPISGVTLTPGHVVAACADRTLRFWPLNAGKEVAGVYGVGESQTLWVGSNGGQVFTAGADGTIRSWPVPLPSKSLGKAGATFAMSADGSLLIVGGSEKNIRVLNGGTGQTAATIGTAAVPTAVAVAGSTVAAGFGDGKVAAFGTDGKPRLDPVAVADRISVIAVSAEKTLLIGGADGSVTLQKVPGTAGKPEPAAKLGSPHKGGVNSLGFLSPTAAYSAGADGSVRLWDLSAKKETKLLGTLPGPAFAAASKDGLSVLAAGGTEVRLVTAADGKTVKAALPAPATGVAFASEKSRVLVSIASAVVLLDGAALNQVATVPLAGLKQFAAVPNGAAVAAADGVMSLIPVPVVKAFAGPDTARGVPALRASNGTLVAGGGKSFDLYEWNPTTGTGTKFLDIAGLVSRVVPARGANFFAAVKGDGKDVSVFAADGKGVGTFPTPGGVADAAFHPTAALLALASGADVSLMNAAGQPGQPPPPEFGKRTQSFPHPAAVSCVAFAADGTLLTGAADGRLRTWKPSSEVPRQIQFNATVDGVAWSPDGKTLAVCGHDGSLRLYDPTKLATLKTIRVSADAEVKPVYAVAWSPDGRQLATAGFDKSVKLWDAADGKLAREFAGHEDGVFAVAFAPDGKLLATGGADRRVKLWDLAAGKLLRDLPNPNYSPNSPSSIPPSHPGFVHAVKFSADGSRLISAGTGPRFQGYLATWNVGDGKLLAGENSAFGPVYSVAPLPDGRVLIGCGPVARGTTASEAVILMGPSK